MLADGAVRETARSTDIVVQQVGHREDVGARWVERFVPDADGKAIELYVETKYAGQRAEMMRRRLRAERLQDVAAKYEDYYRKSYGELGVVTPTTASEDDAANTVLVREHYRLTPGWNQSGLLPLIFAHLFSLELMRDVFARQVQQGKGPAVTAQPA